VTESNRCREREKLLAAWTACSRQVRKLRDEQFAAEKSGLEVTSYHEKIRIAQEAETLACRAYYRHTHEHDCV